MVTSQLRSSSSSIDSEKDYKDCREGTNPGLIYDTKSRDTAHIKAVTTHTSDTNYKRQFVKEKGKSDNSILQEPREGKLLKTTTTKPEASKAN